MAAGNAQMQAIQAQNAQVVADVMAEKVLETLEAAEHEVDEQLHRMERMDDDDLEKLREQRLAQMKKAAEMRRKWLSKGHGAYTEIHDEKEFFDHVKKSKRVVVHFYRPTTWRCEIVDKHLIALARKHVETKFLKINAEKSPFLVERLRVVMLPTIMLCRDGKTEHSIIGFDEMGGGDDFPTEVLEQVLLAREVILERE